ncbi:MAG: glycosyltransferase family 2 protein [candidate division WOR-3 bacterium]
MTLRRVISVVIPVYNERDVLPETYRRTKAVLAGLDFDHEFLFVDDGSQDGSFEVLRELAQRDPKVNAIRFSRNFGHQIAVTAGLDYATGDAVVIMDADLQDEPELIADFVARWQQGSEVVYNIRGRRTGMTWYKRLGTRAFYTLLRRFSSMEIPQNVGLFRLMDRKVVEAVRAVRETNRFLPGIFAWAGFKQTGIERDRPGRAGGRAKPMSKLVALGLDGIISFSNIPLRLALWLGVAVSSVSFLYALYALIRKLVNPTSQLYGWTSTVVIVLFLGGVQLVVMGIIGEYVGRLYDEVKGRPLYVVAERVGQRGRTRKLDSATENHE